MGSMLRAKVAQASLKPIAVEVNGDYFESNLGSLSIPVSSIIGNSSSVKVKSHSGRSLYAQLYVRAPPKPNTDLTGESGDFDITRRIFDFKSGKEIYEFKEAKVNDRYVVLLSGRKLGGSGYYFRKILAMIKDPVPAGFQIESVISPNNRTDSFKFLRSIIVSPKLSEFFSLPTSTTRETSDRRNLTSWKSKSMVERLMRRSSGLSVTSRRMSRSQRSSTRTR